MSAAHAATRRHADAPRAAGRTGPKAPPISDRTDPERPARARRPDPEAQVRTSRATREAPGVAGRPDPEARPEQGDGPERRIRVLVVDDHPVVRQGLVTVLADEDDLDVVGSAASAAEALTLAGAVQPDIVLLDLEMPGLAGIDAIRALLAARAGLAVLVFTAYDTEERVLGAVRAGARGYLLKGASADEIARGVRLVAAGGSYVEPRVAATLMSEVQAPRGPATTLSRREVEVLRLVADGLPTKQIARQLSIAERTVKFHVTSILRKLGADNRAQAVAVAAQRGLL